MDTPNVRKTNINLNGFETNTPYIGKNISHVSCLIAKRCIDPLKMEIMEEATKTNRQRQPQNVIHKSCSHSMVDTTKP